MRLAVLCYGREMTMQENSSRTARLAAGLVLALLACSAAMPQDVNTNAMPGVSFSKFHTYKWVTVEGATYPNQILDTQIKNSIDAQLSSKGLTKVDGDKADLYVAYQGSIGQEKQWNAYGMGGGLRWGGGMATAQSTTISIGTLVLDMYDPTTKQLVWTGRVTKTLDPGANQSKKQKNLDKAMQKLLKNFPPS
jgi:hypothetical protein